MPYGLEKEDLEELLNIVASNEKVDNVLLFGSRAKGSAESGSDVDIALKGRGLNINDIIDLKVLIDQTSIPYKVDLIIYERITEPMLKDHIDRVGIEIYNR